MAARRGLLVRHDERRGARGEPAAAGLPHAPRPRSRRAVRAVDYEPHAADLAAANLRGVSARGTILRRDAFDTDANRDLHDRFDLVYSLGLLEHFDDIVGCLRAVARYTRPGGIVVTVVPNLKGVNWLLPRYGDLGVLETHVIYDFKRLRRPHDEAGLETVAAGYLGFFDGFVSALSSTTPPRRRRIHRALCRTSNMAAFAWLRATRQRVAPNLGWLAPLVYCVARRPGVSVPTL